ncbi:MAG: thioesterase [Bacteroidetes bacterium]|nr:MAG: thioesterase [Bacteroidota bacterium]
MAMHPVKSRMFLFSKLPAAYFSGVRIKELNEEKCVTTVPYRWFSKNPFRSTYFACLAMAAELSTGALVMSNIFEKRPRVSMLIIDMDAEFFKKAVGLTTFVCQDGIAIRDAVDTAIATEESNIICVKSIGTNEAGEPIAEFSFTWSFKIKSKKASKPVQNTGDE